MRVGAVGVPCAEVLLLEASGGLVTALQCFRHFAELDLTLPDRPPPPPAAGVLLRGRTMPLLWPAHRCNVLAPWRPLPSWRRHRLHMQGLQNRIGRKRCTDAGEGLPFKAPPKERGGAGGGGGSIRKAIHHRGRGVIPAVSPRPQTKVTVVGKSEIYNRATLVGPFLVHKILGPRPPLPPLSPCQSFPALSLALPLVGSCGLVYTAHARVAHRGAMVTL